MRKYRTEDESFALRADAQTEAEIAQGKRPTYLVISGVLEPLLNQETGRMIRMQFDPAPYIEKREQERDVEREEFTKKHEQRKADLRDTEGIIPGL